ncbi:Xre family transcriptional regulator [Natranaerovirga hydrolytica]|uniref:Xre family transcriptional regulator n=1 Tax=Natranaerovirga hydrolytica TaxID=680378 RepID=A0A4R1MJA6_9FIRM|nr:helix-turn-helix transcriptional regulator [Natranaerovirga hydrolytica]TCK92557.1 Xre family transcriptional regulator [Natranaerovirga hydrolytica]
MEFAQRVKEIRSKLNMSQEQLARELNISFATVNRWENGKNIPNRMAKKALYDFCKTKELEEKMIKHLLDYQNR